MKKFTLLISCLAFFAFANAQSKNDIQVSLPVGIQNPITIAAPMSAPSITATVADNGTFYFSKYSAYSGKHANYLGSYDVDVSIHIDGKSGLVSVTDEENGYVRSFQVQKYLDNEISLMDGSSLYISRRPNNAIDMSLYDKPDRMWYSYTDPDL